VNSARFKYMNNNNNSLIPQKGISRNGTIDLVHKNNYDKN